jgi:N-acetylmuramoyl-L-alanine amidase
MKLIVSVLLLISTCIFISSCSKNPYASTNRIYKKQAKAYARTLKATPPPLPGQDTLQMGNHWVGTTNFNMRRPNYVVIHHTAQNSVEQTLKTFTMPRTNVSAHYVIGRDGEIYHMLNDYFRAWHGGTGKWGNNTDLNSSSIGIELDNNGSEPFPEAQINSLLDILAILKERHRIPAANFIGHSDMAPSRKVDPNPNFPWKRLAEKGYGLWYDDGDELPDRTAVLDRTIIPDSSIVVDKTIILDSTIVFERMVILNRYPAPDTIPEHFDPMEALRIIGYDTTDPESAIRAFKLHFIQEEVDTVLSQEDKKVLYKLYKKYL